MPQGIQFTAHLKPHFSTQLRRQVLQLRGAQAAVPAIILPVDPAAVAAVVASKQLHHGGIDACVGIESLFHMAHQRVTAFFRQRHGQQTALPQDAAGTEDAGVQMGEHLLRQHQLSLGPGALLLELCAVIRPEVCQKRTVRPGQRNKFRTGMFLIELVDVVALTAVMPAGKPSQILRVIKVVLPHPLIGDGDPGPPQGQLAGLGLRYHRENGTDTLLPAIVLHGSQRGVYVAAGTGDGVVKLRHAVELVADDKTAVGDGVFRVQVVTPHVFDAGAVFAQTVGAGFIVGPQQRHGLCGDRGKIQHE